MKYLKIDKESIVNGIGVRVVLWVSGCPHHCNGCQNPQTWDFDNGSQFNKDTKDEIIHSLNKSYISGLTITGGEPLSVENKECVFDLLWDILCDFGEDMNIWLYTGYTWEEICNDSDTLEVVKLCDVVVDGEFIESMRDVTLPWRGSGNQRVIDVQKSLANNEIVLWSG